MQMPEKNKYEPEKIRNYFGEKVAFYFEFVQFSQKWLIVPTIIGICISLINYYVEENVNNSPYQSIQSIFIIIWATSFIC